MIAKENIVESAHKDDRKSQAHPPGQHMTQKGLMDEVDEAFEELVAEYEDSADEIIESYSDEHDEIIEQIEDIEEELEDFED